MKTRIMAFAASAAVFVFACGSLTFLLWGTSVVRVAVGVSSGACLLADAGGDPVALELTVVRHGPNPAPVAVAFHARTRTRYAGNGFFFQPRRELSWGLIYASWGSGQLMVTAPDLFDISRYRGAPPPRNMTEVVDIQLDVAFLALAFSLFAIFAARRIYNLANENGRGENKRDGKTGQVRFY